MRTMLWCAVLLFVAVGLSIRVRADGILVEGRHQGISAVPAPGPVTIDGTLDDWDLSGEILTYENPEFAEKRHARTAVMYDKTYLYVSAYFKDSTPMRHAVDGRVDKDRGWDGDCLQLKIINDPAVGYPIQLKEPRPVGRDIQLWYCDVPGRNEPQMAIHALNIQPNGELKWVDPLWNFFGADTQAAFRKTDGGYTLETRIAWQRLGMAGPPAPGTKVAFTAQYLWGDDAGKHYATSVNDINAPGGGFTYQRAGGWGFILFEPAGRLARAREEIPKPVEIAKTLAFTYTLPDAGKVSIGVFNAKGLVRTLLTAEDRPAGQITEQWDGLNDFGEVLPAGQYTYKVLTSKGCKQDYVATVLNSGTPSWATADGTGSWGQVGSPADIACAGDRVYLLWGGGEGGNNIQACTPEGKKIWGATPYLGYSGGGANAFTTDGKSLYISQWTGITKHDCATGSPVNFPGEKRGIPFPDGGVSDLVVLNGHLYALVQGTVQDIQLDKAVVARTYAVGAGALGLKPAPGGAPALLFLRSGALCRLDLATAVVTELFPVEMGKPAALAVSPDGRRIYIADQGRLQMDIRIFSYPDGKPAGIVGKPGGRPAIGKFDPHGLFMPGHMAFDGKGWLWVAEVDTSPNRFSVWQPTAKGAAFVKDFLGPTGLSVSASVDPEHPEYVYIQNMRWIVDYDKHTAKLDCTFWRPGWDGPQPGPVLGGRTICVGHARGRTFLYDNTSVWEMLADHAVPVWAYGQGWVWRDANRDGFMQEEEKEKDTGPAPAHYWGQIMRGDLTLEHSAQYVNGISQRPLTGWVNDLPVWAKGDALKPSGITFGERAVSCRWNPAMTRCYTLETNSGYGNNDMRRNGIACYAPDGARLWRMKAGVGMDFSAPITKVGEIRGAQKFIGFIDTGADRGGEVIGVNGYFGNYNLVNEDGLFVAELCQDYRRGAALGPNFIQCENFNGFLFRHPKTKKVYLLGGDIDGRIWEISGLDALRRFQGTLEITPRNVETATQALATYQQAVGVRVTRFTLRRMAAPPALDGALAAWDLANAVKIDVPGRGGKALAAYDDKYLYVAYRVADDTPFLNKGADPLLLFKTGDLVDVILCTRAGADPQRTVGKGDTRILFAPFGDKPIAVVMQKVAQGGPAAPMTYTSSQAPETLERVAILKDVKIGVKTTPDGYLLEAAVPLAAIGFAPEKGKEYPFDFGILYGDTGGQMTILRAYWTNQDTQINNDTPTEARIQPANLGTAVVE